MSRLRRLDVRLFVSYAIVVVVVIAALGVTFGLRATSSFDEQIRGAGESGQTEEESHRAFVDSIWSTVPIALGVSVAAAGLVTLFVARRILRPHRRRAPYDSPPRVGSLRRAGRTHLPSWSWPPLPAT